ncbi:uncharacterized protein [Montipora capricornis]|uniref:uncharacterized protein n=1 Tax=Montipora capricornis TaxID=246305 RepID=UPI0035F20475
MSQKSKQKSRGKPQLEDYAFPLSPQPQLFEHYAQFRDDEPALGPVVGHTSPSERRQTLLDKQIELVKQEKEKLALELEVLRLRQALGPATPPTASAAPCAESLTQRKRPSTGRRTLCQTVYKRGSTKRRVVMDLSFPHAASVNSGIPKTHYLDNAFQLRLPGIDRLREFIISKGSGCYVYKKDLKRAYRQFPIDPKDYKYLGFMWDGLLYFDTRCPFGLRSSALVCQRTTRAVIHVFTKEGYTADVYLDDFYRAEHPADSHFAFARLKDLFDELGLQSSPEKDCFPSTRMICLGILVDTEKMLFEVPADRLSDFKTELLQWTQISTFTRRQLQSLLGKLSFVTACVRPGRIFMARLLNRLRSLPSETSRYPATCDMLSDIDWWLTFLPYFNGSAMIALRLHDFHDVLFTCDSSLHRGGATCFDECISFAFPRVIEDLALHINALELFVLVMAVKIWATKLAGSRFQISCDNDAAVQVVRSGRTRDAFMQRCLRQLWLTSARYDLDLHVSHIPGVHNVFADCLSRWDANSTFQRKFYELASQRNLCFHMLSIDSADLAFDLP